MSKRYSSNEMRLYAHDGSRLYVNESERVAYIKAANGLPPLVRLFCLTLVYTGCRLSEARNLRSEHFQIDERRVSIHTLKRRKSGCIRELPIPDELVEAFNASRSDHGKRGFLFQNYTSTCTNRVIPLGEGLHGPSWDRRKPSLSQRPAAWLWHSRYALRRPTPHAAKMDGPCVDEYDGDLCDRTGA